MSKYEHLAVSVDWQILQSFQTGGLFGVADVTSACGSISLSEEITVPIPAGMGTREIKQMLVREGVAILRHEVESWINARNRR